MPPASKVDKSYRLSGGTVPATPSRRRLPLVVALLLSLLVAAACSSDAKTTTGSSAAASSSPGPTTTSAPTTIRLWYFPNVTHAPPIVRLRKGFFDKARGANTL